MKLIVGLGNPGEKYDKTRHNLGFIIIEKFFKSFESVTNDLWENSNPLKSQIKQLMWQPKHGDAEKVLLCKPQTFMNNSGMAVSLVANYYQIEPKDIWVIHDELDLPLGFLKIRNGGSSAGHKGIDSIIQHITTEKFWRFRCGIGESHLPTIKGSDGEDHKPIARHNMHHVDEYVLGEFTQHDAGKLRELVKHTVKALEEALENGIEVAQNKFNTK